MMAESAAKGKKKKKKAKSDESRTVNEDLASVGRDMEHLTEDLAHLAEDTADAAQRVSDDLIGAEFVASREVVDDIGLLVDFWERVGALQREQLEKFVDDYRETLERLADSEPFLMVMVDHVRRRVESQLSGGAHLFDLAVEELSRAQSVHDVLWQPYLQILGADLTGRGVRRG